MPNIHDGNPVTRVSAVKTVPGLYLSSSLSYPHFTSVSMNLSFFLNK